MKNNDKTYTANQLHFYFFSKQSFSDEKYLNAWSLKGNRLKAKEWLEFQIANQGKFYNEHLKNTLDSMQELKVYFSVDRLEGININASDEISIKDLFLESRTKAFGSANIQRNNDEPKIATLEKRAYYADS